MVGSGMSAARLKRWAMPAVLISGFWIASCLAATQTDRVDARSEGGLAYDVTGAGPWVVLIHGSNLDRRMWDDQVPWLRGGHTVLRYDLRGQGGSATPQEPFSNAADLLSLMDELGAKQVTLVGLSAGAQVALDTALASPGRVRRMVLVSPSLLGYRPTTMPPFFNELVAALRSQDYDGANEVLLQSPLMAVPERYREEVRAMVKDNSRLWSIPYTLVEQTSPPAIERLDTIDVPVLVLAGGDDLEAIRDQATLLERSLPNARKVVVPGGRHLLNMTSPDAFRQALESFLGTPQGADRTRL
jgi:3-oxoadipate enol-lactonase